MLSCQAKNAEINADCTLQEAENAVLNLEEVKQKEELVNRLSNGEHGISLISDSLSIDDKIFYQIQTGYNSSIRFETYYTFYVEKGNCNEIKILDVINGNIQSLYKWREENQQQNSNININGEFSKVLQTDERLSKYLEKSNKYLEVSLPFSLDEMLNTMYDNPENYKYTYPSYAPSDFLKEFLISKGYEAEEYNCYIIPSNHRDNINLLIHIQRSDYEYYIFIISNIDSILDYKQLTEIGDHAPTFFRIKGDEMNIELFKIIDEKENLISKYQIQDDDKIVKIEE